VVVARSVRTRHGTNQPMPETSVLVTAFPFSRVDPRRTITRSVRNCEHHCIVDIRPIVRSRWRALGTCLVKPRSPTTLPDYGMVGVSK
jgi:hypothetical protein